MGRKIPAKKHRGVKDPLKQQAQRMLSLKSKINAPPKDPDEQPVPKSLTELFAFKNKHESKPKQKKKRKNIGFPKEEKQKGNPLSKLKKMPGESGRAFSLRINSAIKTINSEQLEHDYPEDLDDEDNKGEKMAFHKELREKKRRRATGGKKPEPQEPKLTRGQKLTLKKKARKEKTSEKMAESEIQYEHVGFGEIAHAPPALTIKPRKAHTEDGAPRPGKRDLLLNKLLTNNSNSNIPKVSKGVTKVKQKDLPVAERLRRERARLDAVAAYRALKNTPDKIRNVMI